MRLNVEMKLFCTPNSPFSRVARVILIELGLTGLIEVCMITVRDSNSELLKYTPLGKVPALSINSDLIITDTRMVAQYFAHLAADVKLVASMDSIDDYAFESFCLSFLEGICIWVREARRDKNVMSEEVIELEKIRAIRCLNYLEINVSKLTGSFNLASISVTCAIDIAYKRLGFTCSAEHVNLKVWLNVCLERSSVQMSAPIEI
jgi:glutathione S-transferase